MSQKAGAFGALQTRAANLVTGGAFSRSINEAQNYAKGYELARDLLQAQAQEGRLSELEAPLQAEGRGYFISEQADNSRGILSRSSLRLLHRKALVMYLANPLIRRGVRVQSYYVFAKGLTITLPDPDSKAAWEAFWDDEDNRHEFTAPSRLVWLERKLQIRGQLFVMFFIDRVTGDVQVREIDVDEIEEILPDPTDASKPMLYKRVTQQMSFNARTGAYEATGQEVIEYYPDWRYKKPTGPRVVKIGDAPVYWDRPIAHFARERVDKVGIAPSEYMSALDWAKGYTRFLSNRATVAEALSKILLKFTSTTKAGAAKAKEALTTRFRVPKATPGDGDNVGGSAFLTEGQNIEAVNVKGATIDPAEGRHMKLMVCSAFGFGETFFGDVSVGSLATAKSLDMPTLMAMMDCQNFWKEVLTQIAQFVLLQAAKAPANDYSRRVTVATKPNGREYVMQRDENGVYRQVSAEVTFPEILENDVQAEMTAIEKGKNIVPLRKFWAGKVLATVGAENAEDLLALLPDDEKLTEWPTPAPALDETSDPQNDPNGKTVAKLPKKPTTK